MNESLLLVLAFVVTFFLGFLVNIVFLSFILGRKLIERVKKIDEHMVFRWTVAFIVAFAVAVIICQCKGDDQNQSIRIEIHGI